MTQVLNITNGPDKLSLAYATFAGDDQINQLAVKFDIHDKDGHWGRENVKLDSAIKENGFGSDWILSGYNVANMCRVAIFYSFKNRKGRMDFIQDETYSDLDKLERCTTSFLRMETADFSIMEVQAMAKIIQELRECRKVMARHGL